jgi:hypothetical protein
MQESNTESDYLATAKKYPVFISYAMEDGKEYAENIKNVLDGIGFPAFVAHKTIPVGFRNPGERMLEAVDECQFFVLILTPGACKSEAVQKEVEKAISSNKEIFACKRQDVARSLIPSNFIKNDIQRLKFENVQDLAKQIVHILIETEQRFLAESGICRVFLSRHDPDYTKELERCFLDSSAEEILLLGLSLRDWFGKSSLPHHKFAYLVEGALRKGTKFRVLLVDPTSDIAKERSEIGCDQILEQDQRHLKSQLFREMRKVMQWIDDPQVDSETKRLMKENIKARFYDSFLSLYIIKTADYMFVEQYHTGRLGVLREKKIADDDDWRHGGYVPVFLVKNNSDFGRLISDHFNNIWEKSLRNNLKDELKKVSSFEANPVAFRTQQFLQSTRKGCEEILSK